MTRHGGDLLKEMIIIIVQNMSLNTWVCPTLLSVTCQFVYVKSAINLICSSPTNSDGANPVMDDGGKGSWRGGRGGSLHCRGVAKRDCAQAHLCQGALLSSFCQQMLSVPGSGMTKMTQIYPCPQGVHRWMRVSLVSVVTGGSEKQSCFRGWFTLILGLANRKWCLYGFSNVVMGVHWMTHFDSPPWK